VLEGYRGGEKFQSAISIHGKYVVVAFQFEGLFFYKVVDNKL
jgi:hypothetical protein